MIISKTPIRASLFGGGTDFENYFKDSKFGYGTCLSVGLDMHVYITVNKKFDDKIRLVYSGNELVDTVDEIKHDIIREALKIVGIQKGIEIIYMADLPLTGAGLGLASSSALAVGLLNALHAYKGEFVTAKQLAKEACHIEIDCLGQKIGIQDQYAVAYGGFNRYKFFSDGSVSVSPVLLSNEARGKLLSNLILFYTGNARDSRKILSEQTKKIDNNREMLDELVLTCDKVYDSLSASDVDVIGRELDKTWKIKKSLSSTISNQQIDEMYERAISAGASGGKILGAGGGGFMLLYVDEKNQASVRNALKGFREVPFAIDYQGSRIIFTD